MKRLLICLVPWMAMTVAAAQGAPRQAEVAYTHYGPAFAWRVGDDCFVPPSVLANWGWTYVFVGSEATIQAEGRTLKVESKTIDSRMLVPLKPALDQLGAGYAWEEGKNRFAVWGIARSVTSLDGKFTLDSTLAVKPAITFAANPQRVVLDFDGVRLADSTKIFVDKGHVEMTDKGTLQVSLLVDEQPIVQSRNPEPTRSFQLSITPSSGATAAPPIQQSPMAEEPKATPIDIPPSTPPATAIQVSPLAVESDSPSKAVLSLNFAAKLPKPATIRRIDPVTYEVLLPGARYDLPETPMRSDTIADVATRIEGGAAVVRISLTRPMGSEISVGPTGVRLLLSKPAVGNGKLAGKLIVVDPGHGGVDGGTRSPDKTVNEKNLTLTLATLVSQLLVAEGATVIMTRTTDVAVNLKERPAMANRSAADLFVSIHINSNRAVGSRSGGVTYYHKGSTVGQVLAECVQNELGKIGKIPTMGAQSDGKLYDSGLAVLRLSKMPAILIETGFLNHATDRKHMQDSEFQKEFAKAVIRGLKVYYGEVRP